MTQEVVLETRLEDLKLFKRGKVRDVYDLGGGSGSASSKLLSGDVPPSGGASSGRSHDLSGQLLIVATDRVSAFDVVIPSGIPYKGEVLTRLSAFWFEKMKDLTPSHFISAQIDEIVGRHPNLSAHRRLLSGRSMLVEKGEVVPMECVVRGYLSGSGWKEYQKTGAVCGVKLPAGLRESEQLPHPIFTPATKAQAGHDINISEEEMAKQVGRQLTEELKEKSLSIYARARGYAQSRGILIADTKFEFALRGEGAMLVDELLTPDSSRFWPVESYAPGRPQISFDKQFVRDYLEGVRWDKTPPAPELPDQIIRKTSEKYLQALRQLTGQELHR